MNRITVPKGGCGIAGKEIGPLEASCLGSTLAICISDPSAGVSAMAIPLLPSIKDIDAVDIESDCPDVASGLKKIFRDIMEAGGNKKNLMIWLVGAGRFMDEPRELSLGVQIYAATKKILDKNGLSIHAEHVGGSFDRTAVLGAGAEAVTVVLSDGQEVSI